MEEGQDPKGDDEAKKDLEPEAEEAGGAKEVEEPEKAEKAEQ